MRGLEWARRSWVDGVYWLTIAFICAVRLLLTSDLALDVSFSPHDDLLYVSRAYHYLLGEAFGPYDSRLLSKLPGLSLWIAWIRWLGIPYLFSTHLFFLAAGLYFISALRACGTPPWVCLGTYLITVLNPVSFDWQWFRVLREPISSPLLLIFFTSQIFIFKAAKERRSYATSLFILGVSFAISQILREEDKILIIPIVFLGVALYFYQQGIYSRKWVTPTVVVVLPLLLSWLTQASLRSYIKRHYGEPILYEMNEGEYPKLIAAIRSIDVKIDNRYVMVSQEALEKLTGVVPRIQPLFSILPAPGFDTESCQRFGICSEWANAWMLFWVKDAIHFSGLVQDMTTSQSFYRDLRWEIERACQTGKLQCSRSGSGLFPPVELRWFRVFFKEWLKILHDMTQSPLRFAEVEAPIYSVETDIGRKFQLATMTHHFDSQAIQKQREDFRWQTYPRESLRALRYWIQYPEVATDRVYGIMSGNPKRAEEHFLRTAKANQLKLDQVPSHFSSGMAGCRRILSQIFQSLDTFLELNGLFFFCLIVVWWQKRFSPFQIVFLNFLTLSVLRSVAMGYVSIYMGSVDTRLFFSTYILLLSFAPVLIFDGFHELRLKNAEG